MASEQISHAASDSALIAEMRQLHQSQLASSALRKRLLAQVAALPAPEPRRWVAAGALVAVALVAVSLVALSSRRPERTLGVEPAPSAVAVSPAAVPVGELAAAGSTEARGAPREPCPLSQVPPGAIYQPSAVEFGATSDGLELRTFEMLVPGCGALTRRYFLYQPRALPAASAAPLVVVLHDSGDSAEGVRALQAQQSFETLAELERIRVVYANAGPGPATSRFPNSGGWQTDPGANRALDDDAYLAQISSDLRERGIEAGDDVFLVGYGGGAVMALEAAARHPDRYRGVAALLPPRLSQLRPAPQQPGARLSRVLFVTLASERPDYYWPGKPLDPAWLQDWELAVGLPRTNKGIPGGAGSPPPTRSISVAGRPNDVQQFDFAAPALGTGAVRVLVLPRGDELSVGAGGTAAPLDAAARAWEFLKPAP